MRMFTAGCAGKQQAEPSYCRPGNTRHAVHHSPAALLEEPEFNETLAKQVVR